MEYLASHRYTVPASMRNLSVKVWAQHGRRLKGTGGHALRMKGLHAVHRMDSSLSRLTVLLQAWCRRKVVLTRGLRAGRQHNDRTVDVQQGSRRPVHAGHAATACCVTCTHPEHMSWPPRVALLL